MTLRGTILLAVAVIGIGLYLWLEEVPTKDSEHTRNLLGEPIEAPVTQVVQHFFELAPADVVAVHLQHEGQRRATQRQPQGWAGTRNPATIDDFLRSISELGIVKDIAAEPLNLEEYGLQPPRSVVELQRRGDSPPLVMEIGDRNPATTGVYVRIGQNGPVVLAGALVAWEFEKAFRALGEAEPPAGAATPG